MDSLIEKYLTANLTSEEESTLYKWVREDETNLTYFKAKIMEHSIHNPEFVQLDAEQVFQKLGNRIPDKEKSKKTLELPQWFKYAASILLLMGLGYFLNQPTATPEILSEQNTVEALVKKSDHITLTLDDGTIKKIEENTTELSYAENIVTTGVPIYHELVVPRGEVFKLILSDSTTVWLNAESKIRYPKYFTSTMPERKVVVTGEAFFDVTHNKEQPFIVETDDVQVTVLGTKFNISSYQNQTQVATTLVDGSVSMNVLSKPEDSILITPNQQASYHKDKKKLSSKKVDVDPYIAWMQKRIIFQDMAFSTILERIERVYGVDIHNHNNSLNSTRFTGEFDKENIEVVFKALSSTIPFEYEIEDNSVTIK